MTPSFTQRHPVLVGTVAAVVVVVLMAWTVQYRTGGMPLEQMPGSGFTLGQPVTMADMEAAGTVPGAPSNLPVLSEGMPEFDGIAEWLNGSALTQAELRGKVVLIDFWTYSCINCIRTLPYITAWDAKYRDRGLVIVGVHTPEFAFEKDADNVRDALARYGIGYPVALDNDYKTWNNYNNRYWPAKYLFDTKGRLRNAHFGEGDYDETERNIQDLLREAGSVVVDENIVKVKAETPTAGIGTPETYLGYGRANSFISNERLLRDKVQVYTAVGEPKLNEFTLVGDWRIEDERIVLSGMRGDLLLRYRASNANLVMGTEDGAVDAEITLDGAPVPASLRGADIVERDGGTFIHVDAHRLYNIIDAQGSIGTHLLQIRYLTPGVSAYAFTFG